MTDQIWSARSAHDHFQRVEAEKTQQASSLKTKDTEVPRVQEHVVPRDGLRPFSFAGVMLAQASIQNLTLDTVTAAVYRTSGGKFISTFTRRSAMDLSSFSELANIATEGEPDDEKLARVDRSKTNKAEVFETVEDAAGWFKPGRLTDSIRKQLGLDEPIRIE
jgi:hypothetical protein